MYVCGILNASRAREKTCNLLQLCSRARRKPLEMGLFKNLIESLRLITLRNPVGFSSRRKRIFFSFRHFFCLHALTVIYKTFISTVLSKLLNSDSKFKQRVWVSLSLPLFRSPFNKRSTGQSEIKVHDALSERATPMQSRIAQHFVN